MKRLISILAAILLATACEYEFKLQPGSMENCVFVECLPSGADTTFIYTSLALPAYGKPQKDSILRIEEMKLLVDGKEKELKSITRKAKNSYTNDTEQCWYVAGEIKAGSKVKFEVKAEGTEKASAETQVPGTPAISSVKLDTLSVVNDGNDFAYLSIEPMFKEISGYYGIQVIVQSRWTITFEGETIRDEIDETDAYFTRPYESSFEEVEGSDMFYTRYNGSRVTASGPEIYVMTEDQIKGKKFYISGYADGESEYDEYDYDEETGKWTAIGKAHMSSRHRYKIKIYSLSPEFYRFAKARYLSRNNELAGAGLAPANFTYSNVSNGLGILGGISTPWESEWLDNPFN